MFDRIVKRDRRNGGRAVTGKSLRGSWSDGTSGSGSLLGGRCAARLQTGSGRGLVAELNYYELPAIHTRCMPLPPTHPLVSLYHLPIVLHLSTLLHPFWPFIFCPVHVSP